MRVSYVGNFGPQHSTENDLRKALNALGHDVNPLQEDAIDWSDLPGMVDGSAFMLWTRTWTLEHREQLAAITRIQAMGIPIVAYHLDRWWGLARETQVTQEPFFRSDLVYTADGGHDELWKAAGVNHRWLPPGVLSTNCYGGQINDHFRSELAFVGNWNRAYHPEWRYRKELVAWLQEHYGDRIKFWPDHGQSVRGRDLADLYLSVDVIIGDSCLAGGQTRFWSDRIPETLGRGGFLIHPEVAGLEQFFQSENHLMTYQIGVGDGGWGSLLAVIDWSLQHPEKRRRMSANGRAEVLANHTYEGRLAGVIATLETERRWSRSRIGLQAVYVGPNRHYLNTLEGDGVVIDEIFRENVYRVSPPDVAGGTVIDIGAHIGAFSTWAHLAGAAKVIAVEPDPVMCQRLRENTAGLPGIEIVQAAVTELGIDSVGWLPASEVGSGGSRIGPGSAQVQTIRLDTILAMCNRVVLLKLDIEGGEYDLQFTPTRLQQIDRISMEFHGRDTHTEERVKDWQRMVAQLAACGSVTTLGDPAKGGMLYWRSY